MQLSVQIADTYDRVLEVARWAEGLGLAAVSLPDHYLYGKEPFESPAPDALTQIAGLARDTSTIELATLVSPVTFRHPAVYAKIAITDLGNMSERRTARLVDADSNGGVLPMFLTQEGGLESGMMLAQYTAASLTTENKVLAHPASADSIPSSANIEDHVSMGATATRQFGQILTHVESIVAIELLAARVEGEKVWGSFPFYEAAFLGGAKTLRAYRQERFGGDASVYGSLEFRFFLGHVDLLMPLDVGAFGFADGGRVFVSGESPSGWHTAVGGGVWVAPIYRRFTASLSLARSAEGVFIYAGSGFGF